MLDMDNEIIADKSMEQEQSLQTNYCILDIPGLLVSTQMGICH